MFRRYKVDNSSFENIHLSELDKVKGNSLSNRYSKAVKENLTLKFKDGQVIDGSATQNEWFPSIKSDIFLSHSHKDIDRAKKLVGWIKNKFNLDVFIDYNLWGNVNDLLKEIDDEYCYNKVSKTYSYEKRNITTSHAHMMLINALTDMIDKTECLMFLETPNSVTIKKMLHETESPWIYNELFLSKVLRVNNNISRAKTARFSKALESKYSLNESFQIDYQTDTSHLIKLSNKDLKDWETQFINERSIIGQEITHPLDVLYAIKS